MSLVIERHGGSEPFGRIGAGWKISRGQGGGGCERQCAEHIREPVSVEHDDLLLAGVDRAVAAGSLAKRLIALACVSLTFFRQFSCRVRIGPLTRSGSMFGSPSACLRPGCSPGRSTFNQHYALWQVSSSVLTHFLFLSNIVPVCINSFEPFLVKVSRSVAGVSSKVMESPFQPALVSVL